MRRSFCQCFPACHGVSTLRDNLSRSMIPSQSWLTYCRLSFALLMMVIMTQFLRNIFAAPNSSRCVGTIFWCAFYYRHLHSAVGWFGFLKVARPGTGAIAAGLTEFFFPHRFERLNISSANPAGPYTPRVLLRHPFHWQVQSRYVLYHSAMSVLMPPLIVIFIRRFCYDFCCFPLDGFVLS